MTRPAEPRGKTGRKRVIDQQPGEPLPLIPELSLVIAVDNDAGILEDTLTKVSGVLEQISSRWELVVVDDCSGDGSGQILATWSEKDPRIRVLTQRPRQGYAKAVARGFSASRYLTIAVNRVTLPVELREAQRLFPSLREADMVAGWCTSRRSSASSRLAAAVYRRLFRLMLGIRPQDAACALKLFRRSFFEMIRLSSDGCLVDAELFARAEQKGLRWLEVEVAARPGRRGRPLLRLGRLTGAIGELRRLRRDLWG